MGLHFLYYIVLFFAFVIIVITLINCIPTFYTWQSRIFFGKYKDQSSWTLAVLKKSQKWLLHTPSIQTSEIKSELFWRSILGKHKNATVQSWQEASLLLGLTAYINATQDEKSKAVIQKYIKSNFTSDGNWKKKPQNVDTVLLGYALLNLDKVEQKKYQPAYLVLLNILSELIGEDGTIAYRKHTSNFRYVDTVGLCSGFLVKYGIEFEESKWVELGLNQIREFEKKGMFPNTLIPAHTYNIQNQLPAGLHGWGRGMGWYAIGLIDSWNALPQSHPNKVEFTNKVAAFAKQILSFQNSNGSWNWIIMEPHSQQDSSATASLAWFLENAAKIESLSKECQVAKEKALDYLKSVTRRTGAIDFSQGDTRGIGAYSQHFDLLPFTQGFCLRTLFAQTK
jgi:unsaturated rhamnogalacturonyl hydrolase